MSVSRLMPQYQSHKKVYALQIASATYVRDGGLEGDAARVVKLSFEDEGFADRNVSAIVFARGLPAKGDYFIVYPDGYESWSPQAAFEDGYTLIGGE